MSNNQKKPSKQQIQKQKRMLEQQLARQQKEKQQQKRVKMQRIKQLAKKSTPLTDYGLLDSYQYFLGQLAASGIPQGNVFQFAAQSILKFQKNRNKRQEKLRDISKANEEAVKLVTQKVPQKQPPKPRKQFKPQILPFKGQLDQKDVKILPKKQ